MERSWVSVSLFLCESILYSHYLSSHNLLFYATILISFHFIHLDLFISIPLSLLLYPHRFACMALSLSLHIYPSHPLSLDFLFSLLRIIICSHVVQPPAETVMLAVVCPTSSLCYLNMFATLHLFLTISLIYFFPVLLTFPLLYFGASIFVLSSILSIRLYTLPSIHLSLFSFLFSFVLLSSFFCSIFILLLSSHPLLSNALFLSLQLCLSLSPSLSLYISLNFNCQ